MSSSPHELQLCEFGGFLWAQIPSEHRKFRREMRACGVHFRTERNAYRMPLKSSNGVRDNLREYFLFLVEEYYPTWKITKERGCPFWVHTGMSFRVEEGWDDPLTVLPELVTDLDRMAGKLAEAGAEIKIAPYVTDASQHLHIAYRGKFACAVYQDGGRFQRAYFGNHKGPTTRIEDEVNVWLDIPTYQGASPW